MKFISEMSFRLSSMRIGSSISSYFHSHTIIRSYSIINDSNINLKNMLSSSTYSSQSQRTFMFWRANIQRELYGTPNKALATKKHRRLQKSITQIIRDGQLWRLIKEGIGPEWNKWWKELQPLNRRYMHLFRFNFLFNYF